VLVFRQPADAGDKVGRRIAETLDYPADPLVRPDVNRKREKLAVLEAEIAQTCYHLGRLRAERRRLCALVDALESSC
jgi:hypothetical protein